MYTFVFAAHRADPGFRSAPRRALDAVERLFSGLALDHEVVEIALPVPGGACAYLQPAPPRRENLLTTASDGDLFVLAYGDVFDLACEQPARKILEVWKDGGVEAVRALDGSFCAVVADRRDASVHLLSDLAGRRSFFYATPGDGFLASNHDLALAATRLIATELDPDTAASIVHIGWSLGGRSLLRAVEACHPLSFVRWSGKRVERARDVSLEGERIDGADRRGLQAAVDAVIGSMQKTVRWAHGKQNARFAELTAGLDSRAVLGLLLSCIDASELHTTTSGKADDAEVLTAKRLSALYGVRHRVTGVPPLDLEDFSRHANLLAFVTNGETNGQRAVYPIPRLSPPSAPVFSGHAGEGYRGRLYPSERSADPTGPTVELAAETLMQRLHRKKPLAWLDPETDERLERRMASVVADYASEITTGADLLDLYFFYELYRRMAAHGQDNPWTLRVAPFGSPGALVSFFRFPSPRGRGSLVHKTILRRHLGRSYYQVPINLEGWAPFIGAGRLTRLGDRVSRRLTNLIRRRDPGKPKPSTQQMTAEIFSGSMRPMVEELLRAEDSWARMLFPREGVSLLFDQLVPNAGPALTWIGMLVSLEHWRLQLRELCRISRELA